ncbi:MAG: lactonase family protein [Actinobacteria bacterium]|nr:lactonase family protein [Actinomycetota bacterium]
MRQRLWIGTYPEAGQGTPTGMGEGIWSLELDLDTGALAGARQVVVTAAPSFIVASGALLYAVNEEVDGRLTVLRSTGDGLEIAGTARTAGAHPCHLVFSPELRSAVVANYSSGSVSLIRVDSAGLPQADQPAQVIAFGGSGPRADRQEAAHAHYLLPTPARSHLLACDLGTDSLHRLRLEPASRSLAYEGVAATLPPGSGPRHAVFAGSLLHVLGELDGRLHSLAWDEATTLARPVAAIPLNPDAAGDPSHLSHSGRLLAAASRGDDRLCLFALGPDGLPRRLRDFQLPGAWPRHHAMLGEWLVVALQHSGEVVCLDRRGNTRGAAAIPSPACICPAAG